MTVGLKIRIDVYLDVVSTYSYLALSVLQRYLPIWGLDVHIRPVSLPSIMRSSGNTPPGLVPAKAAYMDGDVSRIAELYSVPFGGMPTNHPGIPNPVGPQPFPSRKLN